MQLCPFEECAPERQSPWNYKCRETDEKFGKGVEAQTREPRVRLSLSDVEASCPGTAAESDHESGKHDRDKGGSYGELRHCQAQPHQLVEDRAEARQEEKTKVPPHASALGSRGRGFYVIDGSLLLISKIGTNYTPVLRETVFRSFVDSCGQLRRSVGEFIRLSLFK